MRKILPLLALCSALFVLVACNKSDEQAQQASAEQAPAVLPAPTDPNDKDAWKKYLVSVVTANMQGVKSNHPYMYYVPAGQDDAAVADRGNQLENVRNVALRGVLPGNMMAFGGPDSAITAQLIVDAFKDVQAGAFKDVVVLFIGAPADAETVKQALASSGAEVRFVEAK
jgi:hypothetical protein